MNFLPRLASGAIFLLTSATAFAGEISGEIKSALEKLQSDSFQERKEGKSELLRLGETDPETVCPLLVAEYRTTPDFEVRGQLNAALKEIFELTVLQKSSLDFGMTLGWFLEYNGQNYRMQPQVVTMTAGGPAAEAGFMLGDVITQFDDKTIDELNGKKQLLGYFAKLKVPREIAFQVRRDGRADPFFNGERERSEKLTLTPLLIESEEKTEFPEKDFKEWRDLF